MQAPFPLRERSLGNARLCFVDQGDGSKSTDVGADAATLAEIVVDGDRDCARRTARRSRIVLAVCARAFGTRSPFDLEHGPVRAVQVALKASCARRLVDYGPHAAPTRVRVDEMPGRKAGGARVLRRIEGHPPKRGDVHGTALA